jgi:hypothetical protein
MTTTAFARALGFVRLRLLDAREPIAALPRPIVEVQMDSIFQWIVLAFGFGVIAFGLIGFFRGFSLPPNTEEHRAHGKGDNWRT